MKLGCHQALNASEATAASVPTRAFTSRFLFACAARGHVTLGKHCHPAHAESERSKAVHHAQSAKALGFVKDARVVNNDIMAWVNTLEVTHLPCYAQPDVAGMSAVRCRRASQTATLCALALRQTCHDLPTDVCECEAPNQ